MLLKCLFSRDLFTLNSGNTEPINRNINPIQDFVRTRICDGDTSPAGVNRGAERLITEMQPFLENFVSVLNEKCDGFGIIYTFLFYIAFSTS